MRVPIGREKGARGPKGEVTSGVLLTGGAPVGAGVGEGSGATSGWASSAGSSSTGGSVARGFLGVGKDWGRFCPGAAPGPAAPAVLPAVPKIIRVVTFVPVKSKTMP